MEITVLVLTPLPVEYSAVIRLVSDKTEVFYRDESAYEKTTFEGIHHKYTIIVREPGMKNIDMALAAERAIQSFTPQIALLIGIAGGVKDVMLGDVLVASKVYGYESGKEDIDGFKARPAVETFSRELLARAQVLSRNEAWKKRCSDGASNARVFIGPIAAGEKVVAATNNATFQRINFHFNDTVGLEMEAIGFATAIKSHRGVHGMIVRGISDLCDGKTESDKQNGQLAAAERAAAFAFELLYELDASPFLQNDMELKNLVKEIYGVLFPAALKEIGHDFSNASNNEIREIWKRVKPLFIKEVSELANDPDDMVARAGVVAKLKLELEDKNELQKELVSLLETIKAQNAPNAISIVNSKNIVAGSNITVGGNFRVGDSYNSKSKI